MEITVHTWSFLQGAQLLCPGKIHLHALISYKVDAGLKATLVHIGSVWIYNSGMYTHIARTALTILLHTRIVSREQFWYVSALQNSQNISSMYHCTRIDVVKYKKTQVNLKIQSDPESRLSDPDYPSKISFRMEN